MVKNKKQKRYSALEKRTGAVVRFSAGSIRQAHHLYPADRYLVGSEGSRMGKIVKASGNSGRLLGGK